MPTEELTAEELALIKRMREAKSNAFAERGKKAAATRKANRAKRAAGLLPPEKKRASFAEHVEQPVSLREEVKIDPRWKTVITTCTKCGKVGQVDPVFGVRVVRGLEHKQSWCKECRASTSAKYR